ncbi:MAG: hypothetical protein ACRD3G_09995 [Vicinamibacterales bacterium]
MAVAALAFAAGGPSGDRVVSAQGRSDSAPGLANLEALNQRLLPVFELAGVVFTDADETRGRVVVGVLDADMQGLVRATAARLGVSAQDIEIIETEPIFQVATLRDSIRPVQAGYQIRFSQYVCSLGFNAIRNGVLGFVTASHCSTNQGSVDGTDYYQPLNQVSGELIGTETVDPPYVRNGKGCPKGRVCRSSDSNFVAGADGVGFALGKIAKTTGPNNGSLEIAGEFTITGEAVATSGQVNKVGRTTGWGQGNVIRTCTNTGVSGSNIVLLCQTWVENKNAVIVQGGDSGSPVFRIEGGNNVTLLGNLWGGNSSGTQFIYSPIANIEGELGALQTQ